MKTVLTAEEMRALERACFSRGMRSIDAMERAAEAVVDVLNRRLAPGSTVCFACGPGNNGGDGFAAARLYALAGGRSVAVPACEAAKLSGDARTNYERAMNTPRVWFREAAEPFERPRAWVDALFGTGLSRPADGAIAALIARMQADRRAGSLVVAADVPSGLDATTGDALGAAVVADVTVTFQHLKAGHVLSSGPEYCGEVIVAPIGLAGEVAGAARLIERSDLAGAIPARRRESHKNTFGHLLLIAGCVGMAGAALISARAALRSGVGLVTVACPESIVPIIQSGAPGAMCAPLPEADGAISGAAVSMLARRLEGKTAVAVGPGLSRRAHPDLVRAALESGLPAAVDADALNLIADNPALAPLIRAHHVLTPHPGEAARLIGEKPRDVISGARALARLGATVILKGPTSAILGENLYLSMSGTPGMARAGSGDVLTGVLGALLARGIPAERAAWLADELHGIAGEGADAKYGENSMTATDIVDSLPDAFRQTR